MLKLIKRDKSFVKGYKAYCQEFYDNEIKTFVPSNPLNIDDDWFDRTYEWYAKKEDGLLPDKPKSIHYWAVDGEKFVGEFQLRPEIDEKLMNGIGSIGYSVRCSEWGKGYGKEILRQGLEISKGLGIEKVLLIINDDNIGSRQVCEQCGGVLMDKIELESDEEGTRLVRRYWIHL